MTFAGGGGGGGVTSQFGGPIAAVLTFFWLTFAFFGFILALAGLSALQNYIYKDDRVDGAICTGCVLRRCTVASATCYRQQLLVAQQAILTYSEQLASGLIFPDKFMAEKG